MKIFYNVLVIGAGGTGTYFLKEFSRFLVGNNDKVRNLVIFDGDTVEEKNLARQSFDEQDIGENKAVVMAEVLNEAFGLKWRSMPSYLTDKSQLKDFMSDSSGTMNVIVGCVDNHGCRLLLEDVFNETKNIAYLDSANEFYAGESVFGYKIDGTEVSPCRSYYFPEISRGDKRNRDEISCEELNSVAPQHITTNMLAGQVLFSEVSSLIGASKPHPGLVTFDAGEFLMEYTPYKASAEVIAA